MKPAPLSFVLFGVIILALAIFVGWLYFSLSPESSGEIVPFSGGGGEVPFDGSQTAEQEDVAKEKKMPDGVPQEVLIDLNIFDITFEKDFDLASYLDIDEVLYPTLGFFNVNTGHTTLFLVGDERSFVITIGYSRSRNILRIRWGSFFGPQRGEGDRFTSERIRDELTPALKEHVESVESVFLVMEREITGGYRDMISIRFAEGTHFDYVQNIAEKVGAEVVSQHSKGVGVYVFWTPTQSRKEVLDFVAKIEALNDPRIEKVVHLRRQLIFPDLE